MFQTFHYTRLWREKKGWTQQELASRAHIPRPALSRIENQQGNVTLRTLSRIAHALGAETYQLLRSPFLQKVFHTPLPRSDWEKMGRSVVSGERHLAKPLNQLADHVASLQINRLEAAGAKGVLRVQRKSWRNMARRRYVEALYSLEVVNRLLRRTTKYL